MVKPDWVVKRGVPEKYPFSTMAVGELHRVPVEKQTCKYASFRVLAAVRGRDLGRKFYTRINPEDKAFELFRGE